MPGTLDLDQLRSFVAIAELGSFTAAADYVGRTQSAVSIQVRRLEEQVGRPLFARVGRKSSLTGDGERLLTYARQLLALNEETLSAFNETELTGSVRFGLPDEYSDSLLRAILMRFSHTNPRAEVVVTCADTKMLIDFLHKDQLDLALLTHDRQQCQDAEIVRREQLYWVTSSCNKVQLQDPIPLALGWQDCLWRSQAVAAIASAGRRYRVAYTSYNSSAVGAAVLAGLAVSVLPECALRPGMRVLSEKEGFPALKAVDIAMVRANNRQSPLVDALSEDVRIALNNLPLAAAVA